MAEATAQIPQATALDDANLTGMPSSPRASKRRQSSPSSQSAKRARITPDNEAVNSPTTKPADQSSQPAHASPPPPKNELAPSTRRENDPTEERKRGRRLFGGLLNTLSQTGPNTQQKKRQEIEKRQQEKARLQKEEDESRRIERSQKLRELRTEQQAKFDEKSMRIRHSNMLAMAHSLSTSTEPKLYYKPWKLRSQDAERIEKQIAETEALIENEVAESKRRHKNYQSRSQSRQELTLSSNSAEDVKVGEQEPERVLSSVATTHDDTTDNNGRHAKAVSTKKVPVSTNGPQVKQSTSNGNNDGNDVRKHGEKERERLRESLDDNENHEVLMEGEEDTVIY